MNCRFEPRCTNATGKRKLLWGGERNLFLTKTINFDWFSQQIGTAGINSSSFETVSLLWLNIFSLFYSSLLQPCAWLTWVPVIFKKSGFWISITSNIYLYLYFINKDRGSEEKSIYCDTLITINWRIIRSQWVKSYNKNSKKSS